MYVVSIILRNWMRFKGEHDIDLTPEIYGVTARWSESERRSNWGGKSALLEAIRFALYGKHRFKSDDSWVSRWEKKGEVVLELSDGTIIRRSKSIGSSEKLTVGTIASGEEVMKGDEAQLYINQVVGMDLADAESTWYIGQKKTSRFITDDPGTRMDVVVGWLRLAPLQQAYDSVTEQLATVLDEVAILEAGRRASREVIEGIAKTCGMVATTDTQLELDEMVQVAALDVERAQLIVRGYEKYQLQEADVRHALADAQEYQRVLEQGKALRAKMDGYAATVPNEEQLKALQAAYDATTYRHTTMAGEVVAKQRLSTGQFDGTCPVNSCVCPVKDKINADTALNSGLLQIARLAYDESVEPNKAAQKALTGAQSLVSQWAQDGLERTRLLAQVAKLRPAFERAQTLAIDVTLPFKLIQARSELVKVETERYSLIASQKMVAIQKKVFDNADAELGPLREEAQLFREAQQILGRQGAQRRIAEAALSEIEINANYALGKCGIDLELKLQWAREGKGLAKTCESCGSAFGSSQKVKVCTRCGVERGPHLVNEFKVELSNQSGSAEDLAGIAMNLAAADWFRRDRQAAWSTVILDEPLSACDAENAAAVAGHLPGLLRHFGFTQAFVCSHSPSHMASMPKLIEIEAGHESSRITQSNETQSGFDWKSVSQVDGSKVAPGKTSRRETDMAVQVPVRKRGRGPRVVFD
jgi:DNA repair exonuclease SbcCD ATPase subunit